MLDLFAERLPVTLLLNVLTVPIIYGVSIWLGLYAGQRKGRWFDHVSGVVLVLLWSLPVIWVATVMLRYLASEDTLMLFPSGGLHDLRADQMPFWPRWNPLVDWQNFQPGWLLDMLWRLVLPVVCMVYGSFAVMSKVMRGAIIESLSADYVRTARAKGLSEQVVLWRHAFRNTLLPLITMVSGLIPSLLVGSVIIEQVFDLNGMGKLSFEAAMDKDREVLMASVLIGGMLKLFFELVRDVCYAIADPRVSYA